MAQKGVFSAFREHERVPYDDGGPSMTRQEFSDECDINKLMERYDKAGVWPIVDRREPAYLDLSAMPSDLMGTLEMLREASDSFMTLPAVVRREFDNDPVKFVDYAWNPDNLEKMREWGLAPPAEVPAAPMKVEIVNGSPSELEAGQAEAKKG